MYGQHFKNNVDILPVGLLFTKKETLCDQLIKLIKCAQSVSEFVSFVWAWKAEEQQSGNSNSFSGTGKLKTWVYVRKLTLNQAGLSRVKLKKIVPIDLPTSARKMQPFTWPC